MPHTDVVSTSVESPLDPSIAPDVWADPRRPSLDQALDAVFRVIGQREPDRLTHPQVVAIARTFFHYTWVCRFFTMQVEDAAERVNGACADDYPLPVGLAIVKDFCNRWNGCPEEACRRDG